MRERKVFEIIFELRQRAKQFAKDGSPSVADGINHAADYMEISALNISNERAETKKSGASFKSVVKAAMAEINEQNK